MIFYHLILLVGFRHKVVPPRIPVILSRQSKTIRCCRGSTWSRNHKKALHSSHQLIPPLAGGLLEVPPWPSTAILIDSGFKLSTRYPEFSSARLETVYPVLSKFVALALQIWRQASNDFQPLS